MSLIHVEGLSKTYKVMHKEPGLVSALRQLFKPKYQTVQALKDMSFDIMPGELVGYIGPNGAGKSTTVKIMSGILTPTEGVCRVAGKIPWEERKDHVRNIGVVFGQRSQLWWDVPVLDSFMLLKDIYKIPQTTYDHMLGDLTKALDLEGFMTRPVRQLSLGQRMRCELAASLLHNPPVLFLDEPTIGLDATSKLAVRSFIREINERYQTTVILTTHDMDDLEAICSRVIVVGRGEKLYDGNMIGLRNLVKGYRTMTVDYEQIYDDPIVEGADLISLVDKRAKYRFDPSQIKGSTLIKNISRDYQVEDVILEDMATEEVIAKLYEVMAL